MTLCGTVAQGQHVDSVKQLNQKETVEIRAGEEVKQRKELLKVSKPKIDKGTIPDSTGVVYENGKVVLPNKPNSPAITSDAKVASELLKKPSPDDLSNEMDNTRQWSRDKVETSSKILEVEEKSKEGEKQLDQLKDRADSTERKFVQTMTMVEQIRNGGIPVGNKIYSHSALKEIYDSLGVSRLDSVMALASTKKEVSKDDLLSALNASFPSAPVSDSEMIGVAKDSAMAGLPTGNIPGELPDLSSLKLSRDDLMGLPPLKGFQLPTDSIPFLDSLRRINLKKERLKLNEDEVGDRLKSVSVIEKPSFWDRSYFEGVLSLLKFNDMNSFQFSPAFGFHLTNNLSVGVGPNLLFTRNAGKLNVTAGYRSFVKYEVLRQRGYIQAEDIVDPQKVNEDYGSTTRHNLLTGVGGLLPISKQIAINVCALYRVNNNRYSDNTMSPWVIRLGISSTHFKKKNNNP